MIDNLLKKKLRFNDPLTFTESHILYDCAEKLENIKQIIKDHDNDSMPEDYWYIDRIREVLENE